MTHTHTHTHTHTRTQSCASIEIITPQVCEPDWKEKRTCNRAKVREVTDTTYVNDPELAELNASMTQTCTHSQEEEQEGWLGEVPAVMSTEQYIRIYVRSLVSQILSITFPTLPGYSVVVQ